MDRSSGGAGIFSAPSPDVVLRGDAGGDMGAMLDMLWLPLLPISGVGDTTNPGLRAINSLSVSAVTNTKLEGYRIRTPAANIQSNSSMNFL